MKRNNVIWVYPNGNTEQSVEDKAVIKAIKTKKYDYKFEKVGKKTLVVYL